jgi:hypothetical protein
MAQIQNPVGPRRNRHKTVIGTLVEGSLCFWFCGCVSELNPGDGDGKMGGAVRSGVDRAAPLSGRLRQDLLECQGCFHGGLGGSPSIP